MRIAIIFLLWATLTHGYSFVNILRKQYPLVTTFSPVHPGSMTRTIDTAVGARILDIGCGSGASTKEITRCIQKDMSSFDITGIDKDEFKIMKASYHYPQLRFGVDDIRNSRLPSNEFDLLFISNVFQEIPARDFGKACRHMKRIARNENSLLFVSHQRMAIPELKNNLKKFVDEFDILYEENHIDEDRHLIIARAPII